MLDLFLSEIPNNLEQMQTAINNNELKNVSAIAHRIKPALMNMGIVSINNQILFLESQKENPAEPEKIAEQFGEVMHILQQVLSQLQELRNNAV
jgi:HPt (histidine-containing phosphotransfer) domain-containing protein